MLVFVVPASFPGKIIYAYFRLLSKMDLSTLPGLVPKNPETSTDL
jgi:hypothetical protein